jgi:HK97 family phage portal protein
MNLFEKVANGLNLIFEQTSEVVTWTGSRGWSSGSGNYNQRNYLYTPQLTKSGNAINGRQALAISAFYDGVRMIAEDIAKLEMQIFTEDATGNKVKVNKKHPLYRVISMSPDGVHTAQQFWETMIAHSLVWGNGYAIIDQNRANGKIRSLQSVHPNRVTIRKKNGIVTYLISTDSSEDRTSIKQEFTSDQIFRLRGVGDEDSAWPIANFARESLGITLATQTLQSNMFSNGINIGGVLQTEEKLEKEHRASMATEWEAKYGGANNFGKTAVLDKGLTYTPFTSIKSTDAELLETRRFQVEEVARWLRIPLHKLGILESNATFNNIEQENIKYVTETLGAWMKRILFEVDMKLLKFSPRFFVEYDIRPLTMADSQSRANYWSNLIDSGMATPNDGAKDLGLSTYPEGDKHYITNNVQPVDQKDIELQKAKKELERSDEQQTQEAEREAIESSEEKETTSIERNEVEEKVQKQIDSVVEQSSSVAHLDPLNDLLGRYQQLMIHPLQLVVNTQINYFNNIELAKVKNKDNFKFDEHKEARFYTSFKEKLMHTIEPFVNDLQMAIPDNYADKWAHYLEENWQSEKAHLMANDLLKHYLQINNLPTGIYNLERPDGTVVACKIDDQGVISEIQS